MQNMCRVFWLKNVHYKFYWFPEQKKKKIILEFFSKPQGYFISSLRESFDYALAGTPSPSS